jgi:hypothetical protein
VGLAGLVALGYILWCAGVLVAGVGRWLLTGR